MTAQCKFLPFGECQHKGFYNNGNAEETLKEIAYTKFYARPRRGCGQKLGLSA